jgi:hypothetical protein
VSGPEDLTERSYTLSPSQGVALMCLSEMLKEGDLAIRGDDDEAVDSAVELLADVAQEIALQVGQDG